MALPEDKHFPPGFLRLAQEPLVALAVTGELRSPELGPRFWNAAVSTAFMRVPETAMAHDGLFAIAEANVRTTGDVR